MCPAGAVNTLNVRAFEMPPPPPSVGVDTVTGMDPAVATSAEEIAAFKPEGLANVVVRGLPLHWTTEHGAKVPVPAPLESTPSINAGDPEGVLEGRSVAIAGLGSGVVEGAIVKGEDAEAKEGIVELETVMVTGPGKAVSTAEIAAVSCVALTNVVARGEPFQVTVSPLATKLVPFTVRVIPSRLQAGVVFEDDVEADSDVMVGSTIGNASAFDVLALDAGLATAT